MHQLLNNPQLWRLDSCLTLMYGGLQAVLVALTRYGVLITVILICGVSVGQTTAVMRECEDTSKLLEAIVNRTQLEIHSNVLIIVTGGSSCQPCVRLNTALERDTRITDYFCENEIACFIINSDTDYTEDCESKLSKATVQLEKYLHVEQVPTFIFLSNESRVVGWWTGFPGLEGVDDLLENCRNAHACAVLLSDQLVRGRNTKLTESEKAHCLDRAVTEGTKTIKTPSYRGCPAMLFYPDICREIIELSGKGELALKYKELLSLHKKLIEENRVLAKLEGYAIRGEWDEAINLVVSYEEKEVSASLRYSLEIRLQKYIERNGDYDYALRNLDRLLTSSALTESIWFEQRRMFALLKLGDLPAFRSYRSVLISKYADDQELKLRILEASAQMLVGHANSACSVSMQKDFVNNLSPRHKKLTNALYVLALEQVRNGEKLAAKQTLIELICVSERSNLVLLAVAETYSELGCRKSALDVLKMIQCNSQGGLDEDLEARSTALERKLLQ